MCFGVSLNLLLDRLKFIQLQLEAAHDYQAMDCYLKNLLFLISALKLQ